ncbi:DUF485 domain-containing protein [Leucobacter chromiireducens]|uniref:DUF485 domain-containing protein n=1 Tax=Leucobacter chromiireducens TaxID=283877 RepID=UPI001F1534F3|nr:DUF485 domain-containing protein [Leucobacter chromiireducens]
MHDQSGIDYIAFQESDGFRTFKHRFRRFVFPLAIAFLAWFLTYVLLAAYAHDFMAQPLWGLNVGLWFGLGQFVTTFIITMSYVAYANRRLDPLSQELRAELEHLAVAAGDTEGSGA